MEAGLGKVPVIFNAICEALDKIQEALTVSTMLRHRRFYERRLRRVVRRMFRAQSKALIVEGENGAFTVAMIAVEQSAYIDDFGDILAEAYQHAWDAAERDLKEDLEPGIVALMRQRAAQRITGIDATTRDLVAALVDEAVRENWAYTKLAAGLRRLFADFGKAVPQRHLRDRAELIAVTEVGQAYTDGQMDLGRRREAAGVALEKSWLTVGDDRVSEGCIENQRQGWILFAQAFSSGHTSPLRFPGCRCALQTRKRAA